MAISYSGVRNPSWANKQQTLIHCEVSWDHVAWEDWSPCAVVGSGDEPYIHEIFDRCVAGDFGEIAAYVTPADMPATADGGIEPAMDFFIRERRNDLLRECDIMMLADNWNAMTAEKQQEWTSYRQALRDMPSDPQYANLVGKFNDDTNHFEPSVPINWPVKPA